jgi:hypothetical protein
MAGRALMNLVREAMVLNDDGIGCYTAVLA